MDQDDELAPTCRICLDPEEPLLNDVCDCHAHVHVTCLDTWRQQFPVGHSKRDACEVCLAAYTLDLDDIIDITDSDDEEEPPTYPCCPLLCLVSTVLVGMVGYAFRFSPGSHTLYVSGTVCLVALPIVHGIGTAYCTDETVGWSRIVQTIVLLLAGFMLWVALNPDNVDVAIVEYIFAVYFFSLLMHVWRACR